MQPLFKRFNRRLLNLSSSILSLKTIKIPQSQTLYRHRYCFFNASLSPAHGGHIIEHLGRIPKIDNDAFIALNAVVIGDTVIDKDASIWYNCVLRGDVASIRVGERTNIQDGTIIHCNSAKPERNIPIMHTIIGKDVTVGHGAILHACTINDRAFIGMQACVMDGVTVETDAMVGAGALVTPGKTVKSGELWAGRPAKKIRDLTEQEKEDILDSAVRYCGYSKEYMPTK